MGDRNVTVVKPRPRTELVWGVDLPSCGDAVYGRAEELLGGRVEPELELVLEAHGAQEPQRVVGEDRLRDGAKRARSEVLPAPERVDWLAALEGHGDRVDGEVAAREIFFEKIPLPAKAAVV